MNPYHFWLNIVWYNITFDLLLFLFFSFCKTCLVIYPLKYCLISHFFVVLEYNSLIYLVLLNFCKELFVFYILILCNNKSFYLILINNLITTCVCIGNLRKISVFSFYCLFFFHVHSFSFRLHALCVLWMCLILSMYFLPLKGADFSDIFVIVWELLTQKFMCCVGTLLINPDIILLCMHFQTLILTSTAHELNLFMILSRK